VEKTSENPAFDQGLSDHQPLMCSFRIGDFNITLMTWNVLDPQCVSYLTGDFENGPPKWWDGLDSQMGLENNPYFKKENADTRFRKIRNVIWRYFTNYPSICVFCL